MHFDDTGFGGSDALAGETASDAVDELLPLLHQH